VRFDRNDYSVPVCHAFEEVVVKGYADRVEISRRTVDTRLPAGYTGDNCLTFPPPTASLSDRDSQGLMGRGKGVSFPSE
jgi:hypothetical protein